MTPSLMVPSVVVTTMRDLGYDMPNGKEGTILDAGLTWVKHASASSKPPQDAHAAAAGVWSGNKSAAVEAFQADFTSPNAPHAKLANASAGSAGVGIGLMACAGIVLGLKVSDITQVTLLLVEIAEAVATASLTFGTSLLEIPAFKEAASLGINAAINVAMNAVMGL
jgi:hypothetical protein